MDVQALPAKAAYRASVNEAFEVTAGESGATFIAELYRFDEGRSTPIQEQFSLVFRAPPEAPAQQGMYRLEHARLGTHELFLVPIRRDESGLFYEAVFNRLLDRAQHGQR